MSPDTPAIDPAVTERHLANLDKLAEIGMVLARRLRDLPPLKGQDTARDLDLIARAVRRAILLYHAIVNGTLPKPPIPTARTDRDPAAPARDRSGGGIRLDAPERLDDISAPFEHIVTGIIRDIQAALATSHGPVSTPEPAIPAGITPDRPEADESDLD